MSLWTAAERRLAIVLGVSLAATYALLFGSSIGNFFMQTDLNWYGQIARGNSAVVMQPFASRQLGPLVVRAIVAVFHCSLGRAFWVEGWISLLTTLTVVCVLATRTAAPRWLLAAILSVPFWPQLLFGLVLPDLWYAALLSVFLLLLHRERFVAAACMLFPLMLSRESTSLALLCFLWSAWRRLRWKGAAIAVAATAAGGFTVSRFLAGSVANLEHLPPSLYVLSKIPWNFLRNFIGLDMWTNMNTSCGTPVWKHSLHLGGVQAVGFCGISKEQPFLIAQALLTTFGLLPLFVAAIWWRRRRAWRAGSAALRFCLCYGGISFLLAPVIGVSFYRLFGYAWPLFGVAAALLFAMGSPGPLSGRRPLAGVGFLLLHLLCCWLTFLQQVPSMVGMEGVVWAAGGLALWRYLDRSRQSPFAAAQGVTAC